MPSGGGDVQVLTTPDTANGEQDHYFPSLLPDGRGVLFTIMGNWPRQVAVLDLKTGQRKTLIHSGGQAEYVDSGHLIYADGGALWAVRFDFSALQVHGDPVPRGRAGLDAGRHGVRPVPPRHPGVCAGGR